MSPVKRLRVKVVGFYIEKNKYGLLSAVVVKTEHEGLRQTFRQNLYGTVNNTDERLTLAIGLEELVRILNRWHLSMAFMEDPERVY